MNSESLLEAIDRLAELEKNATQGRHIVQAWINPDAWIVRVSGSEDDRAVAEYGPLAKDDAELHAAMRNAFPELLACARALVPFGSEAPEPSACHAAQEALNALFERLNSQST